MNDIIIRRVRSGRYGIHASTTLDGKPATVVLCVARDDFHGNWVVTGTSVTSRGTTVTSRGAARGERLAEVRNQEGGIVLSCRNTKRECILSARSIAARGFRLTPDGRVKPNFLRVSSNARLADEQQAALEVFKKLEEGKSSH